MGNQSFISQEDNITDIEKTLLAVIEQHKIILEAQKALAQLGYIGFYVGFHPTIDIEGYEKYMEDYLPDHLKPKYEEWKKEYPDMANYFTSPTTNTDL